MYKKNVFGVNGDIFCFKNNKINPMITPITIRRQDSGKTVLSFGVMWKPVMKEKMKKIRNLNIVLLEKLERA
jgi:hypothetical protein